MNGDRNYTGAAGKISDHWRSNCFLKIDTEGDKTRGAGSRRRLGPCSNLKVCPLSPAWGGRRKKSDGLRSTSPLKILEARMRSARRRLRSSEKRLSWQSLFTYGTWQRSLTIRFARGDWFNRSAILNRLVGWACRNSPWSGLFVIQSQVIHSTCKFSSRKRFQKPPESAEFL